MSVGITGRIARTAARRPWTTLGLWLVGLTVAVLAAGHVGDALTQEGRMTVKTDWETAQALNDQYRGDNSGTATETIVVTSDDVVFGEPAFTAELSAIATDMRGIDGVVDVALPSTDAPFPVSLSGHTALVTVTVLESADVDTLGAAIIDAAEANATDEFRVLPYGNASAEVLMNGIAEDTLAKGETIGIAVALVILAVVFGALVAAGIPILLGIASILVSLGLTAAVGQIYELNFFIVNMITMMGLALSIDYSLIQVQRFREERAKGRSVDDAVTIAGNTANRAVLISGATVVASLSGLLLVPSTIMRSLGGGAILTAIATLLVALTLLPALLKLMGDRVNKGRIPTAHPGREPRRWAAVARGVTARPAVSATIGAGILVALAIPALGMRLSFPGLDAFPADNTLRQAQDILVADFGYGRSETLIAIENASGATTEIEALANAIDSDPGFAETSVDSYGDVVFIDTKDFYDASDIRAEQSIHRLHDEIIPEYLDGSGATAYLGGDEAGSLEFTGYVVDSTPGVLAVVLATSFTLLLLAFRSVVIPLTGIVLNLLSTAAAYGILVAVFQNGWGAGVLGMPVTGGIAPWIPLFLFAVLFGLSMDYHVFLLSRIKEAHDVSGDTRASVVAGLSRTGSMITGAALIMVAVFAGFAIGDMPEFCQMGLGLGAAIIIDATVVRTILVPATMTLLGRRNWYLPRWLEWLPRVSIDGGADLPDADLDEELEPALV